MFILVGCLEHSDNGIQTDAAVLMLLARMAATPFTAKQLLHLGAERLLHDLQIHRSAELQPLITAALSALLSAPNLAVGAHFGRMRRGVMPARAVWPLRKRPFAAVRATHTPL